jgi:hypothetical protein
VNSVSFEAWAAPQKETPINAEREIPIPNHLAGQRGVMSDASEGRGSKSAMTSGRFGNAWPASS